MKKQTAVEWFIEQLTKNPLPQSKDEFIDGDLVDIINKAKEMEAKQRQEDKLTGMKEANELRLAQEKQMENLLNQNRMKTAVEQFLDAIKNQISLSNEHLEMIESYASQAKEMEKQQIMGRKYTERQLDDAISYGINNGRKGDVTITNIDNFINSLNKQD
jgi:hypothetical protein